MRRTHVMGLLCAVVILGGSLAAAPRLLNRVQIGTDPVEILQRRVDVLEMQLREFSIRMNAAEATQPLAGEARLPELGNRLAEAGPDPHVNLAGN